MSLVAADVALRMISVLQRSGYLTSVYLHTRRFLFYFPQITLEPLIPFVFTYAVVLLRPVNRLGTRIDNIDPIKHSSISLSLIHLFGRVDISVLLCLYQNTSWTCDHVINTRIPESSHLHVLAVGGDLALA